MRYAGRTGGWLFFFKWLPHAFVARAPPLPTCHSNGLAETRRWSFAAQKSQPKKLCGEKKREANKELATRSVAREKLGSLGKEITQIDPQ